MLIDFIKLWAVGFMATIVIGVVCMVLIAIWGSIMEHK